jgi:hypothetical protein
MEARCSIYHAKLSFDDGLDGFEAPRPLALVNGLGLGATKRPESHHRS